MTDDRLGILLVEDERQLSRAISRVLRAHGFDVVAAPSAAMARVLECRFRVGVFDIELGDGCGVELAERMLVAGNVEAAVFFTAMADSSVLERAESVGPVIAKREGVAALLPVLSSSLPRQPTRESGIVPAAGSETAASEARRRLG